MAKTKCSRCNTLKTNVKTLSNGEKVCPECVESSPDKATPNRSGDEVSDNTSSSTAPTVGKNQTDISHFVSIMLDKFTALSEKIGGMMYLRERVEDLTKTVHFLSAKYDEQKTTIAGLQTENAALREENAVTMNSVCDLKKQNDTLQQRVEELEQYTRLNNIELVGIPESTGEDVYSLAQRAAEKMGVTLSPSQIDVAHRVPTQSQTQPKPIVMRLTSRKIRDEILMEARKKKLVAKNIDDNFPERPVFFNEHLTPAKKQLMGVLRQKKQEGLFKFVWTRSGTIYVKKTESSTPVKVFSVQDLKKL